MLNYHLLYEKIIYSPLFRATSVFTIGNILNAGIPFMLMPIMTRYLSPEEYGITTMFSVLLSIYTPFVGLNLHGFVSVSYFKKNIDFTLLVSTCFRMLVVFVGIVGIVTFLGSNIIGDITAFPSDWLWAVLLLCFCSFFVTVLQTIQQIQGRSKQYVKVQIAHTATYFALSILFVVFWGWNWKGRVLAQVIGAFVFFMISFHYLRSWGLLRWRFSKKYMQAGIRFGLPLLPHALCGFLMVSSDRLFISHMLGLKEVGIFSVGYSLGNAIELFGEAFNRAFSPWLYRHLQQNDEHGCDSKRMIVKFSYACMIGFLCFALLYSYFMPWFLSFFLGEKYQLAAQYIFAFSLSAACNAMYYIVVNYIFYCEKTNILAILTFGNGIAHICITYMMICEWGAIGAAWAAVVTQTLSFFGTWWLSNHVYPMPWNLWK